jgi:hypothetical protein
MNWFRKIIATWKDATEQKCGEKPYIMDELLKPSSWKILGWYFAGMMVAIGILAIIDNDRLAFWVGFPIIGGFGVLGQALIKDKFITSRWTTSPVPKDSEESAHKEHSDENQSS